MARMFAGVFAGMFAGKIAIVVHIEKTFLLTQTLF